MNRRIRELLKNWVIPPGFQSLIRQVLARRQRPTVPPALEAEFARNIKFRDIHRGQRCFILATGPSINKQDLRPLKDEICIAVSMFFLPKDYRGSISPYHICAPNHLPYGDELPRKWLEGINKVCSEKTTLIVGHRPYEHSCWNFVERNPEFRRDNIHYLNYCHSQLLDETNYNNPYIWDICKPLFSVRTVVYSVIEVAELLGAKDLFMYSLPDNRFGTVPLLDIVKIIEDLIEKLKPSVIYTHYAGDLNIDHTITNRAVIKATRPTEDHPVKEIYAFEVLSSTDWNSQTYNEIFMPNSFLPLNDKHLKTKIDTMKCYKSEIKELFASKVSGSHRGSCKIQRYKLW